MAWTHFPIAADDLITTDQYEEIYGKALILYDVFAPGLYDGDYDYPANKDLMVFGTTGTGGGPIIALIRKLIAYMHWYGTVNSWWRGYFYWDNGDFVQKTVAEVVDAAGLGAKNETWAAPDWALGEEYEVDDVVYWGTFKENRARCIQPHTGAGGAYYPAETDTAYWKVMHHVGIISELNDGKTILDWIAANGWVKRFGTTTGTAADPQYQQWKRLMDATTWYEARVNSTADAQDLWDYTREFMVDLSPHPEAPKIRVLNRYYDDPTVRWDEGAGSYNIERYVDVGRVIDSSDWNDDLKKSGCDYKLFFDTHNPQSSPNGIGVMKIDIKFDGVVVGTINDSSGAQAMAACYVGVNYAEWDFVAGVGDITCDDTMWANLFLPPDLLSSPTTWEDDPPTDYYIDDQVEHNGTYYYCIQDNTSDINNNQPGTVNGDAYWTEIDAAPWGCWYSNGSYQTYTWTVQKITDVFIKPDFTYY